jgi:hypothetical protein
MGEILPQRGCRPTEPPVAAVLEFAPVRSAPCRPAMLRCMGRRLVVERRIIAE